MYDLSKIKKGTFATQNSKEVKEGCIFFANKGATFDGHNFIQEALEKGALLVFHSQDTSIKSDRLIHIPNLKQETPKILSHIYSIPNNLTAVTGTNGKTSTAFFASQSFAMLGIKSAFIGTTGVFVCEREEVNVLFESTLTTPDIISFYRLLHEIKTIGIEDVFFEASSIGLYQKRIEGLVIKTAIFTNFTQDHLDFHKTMNAYFESKLTLFSYFLSVHGTAIVNMEDETSYAGVRRECEKRNIPFYSVGINRGDFKITKYKADVSSIQFDCNLFQNGKLNLTGTFQLFNVMLCLPLLTQAGFNVEDIKSILPKLKAPKGRMEHIKNNIFIDYAHTPDSLLKALLTLNELKNKGKVIVLFGCGGDRDKTKRSLMGEIASKHADFTIITDDNPRTEDAAFIRSDIIKGFTGANFIEIEGREKAIIEAIKLKTKDDILLIAGKGHEAYQIIGKEKFDFNEKEIILNYIACKLV